MSMLGRTGRVPGPGHLNWSLRRWRTSVGGDCRKGRSSVREQNGQRHVSIVCIKTCKPEDVSPCTSSWGLVPLLLQALFLYPIIKNSNNNKKNNSTPSLLRIEEDQEEAVFREVVSFTPDPLPGEKDRGSEHCVHVHSGASGQGCPFPISSSLL